MKPETVNALSSAVIAFVTVLGLMGWLYYNMRAFRVSLWIIIILEIILFSTILIYTSWVVNKLKTRETNG